ncbi:hypothetical protein CN918_26540 [Priestia megaterium]|nr:hypothetical protein CN918_26540 [Priestia megaterium]
MFSFLSPYGGYIRAFGLHRMWSKISAEEQLKMKEAYAKSIYPDTMELSLIDSKTSTEQPSCSVFSFLYGMSVKLIQQKEYNLAERALMMASKKVKEPMALHSIYNLLIDMFYKQRGEDNTMIDKCIRICRKDMKLAPHITTDKQEIPSFKRLAIILESQGDLSGAIEVSKMALQYGLDDGTKGGFQGRIEKLSAKSTS